MDVGGVKLVARVRKHCTLYMMNAYLWWEREYVERYFGMIVNF